MRELLALLLIITLAGTSMFSVYAADSLCGKIESYLQQAESSALENRWQDSKTAFNSALKSWLSAKNYSHVFIRHPEIDSCTEIFYELQEAIISQAGPEIQAVFNKLYSRLESIAQMEKLKFGNVF